MTSLQMPKVQKSILNKKDEIISEVKKIIKKENVLSHEDEIRPYETDALTAYRQKPLLVVLPETVEEVKYIKQSEFINSHTTKLAKLDPSISEDGAGSAFKVLWHQKVPKKEN